MRPRQLLQRKCSRKAIRGAIFPEAFDKIARVQQALVLAATADGDERHL